MSNQSHGDWLLAKHVTLFGQWDPGLGILLESLGETLLVEVP